jgi:hypothetical protein
MKLRHGSDKSLESFAVFPYVAWGVTIAFAFFVYNIAVELQDTAARLEIQTKALEQNVANSAKGDDLLLE